MSRKLKSSVELKRRYILEVKPNDDYVLTSLTVHVADVFQQKISIPTATQPIAFTYKRMIHEKDERQPNMLVMFALLITDVFFCLISPFAIVDLPKCVFKGCCLFIRGFICPNFCSGRCHGNHSTMHRGEQKRCKT